MGELLSFGGMGGIISTGDGYKRVTVWGEMKLLDHPVLPLDGANVQINKWMGYRARQENFPHLCPSEHKSELSFNCLDH